MYLISFSLYCVRYFMGHCSNLYHVDNNNYNKNYSLVTVFFASHAYSLFLSHDYSIFCSQTFCKHYTYSLDLHKEELQAATSLKAD